MIQLERHERILEHLNTHRFLSADQALALFGASPATIRRDFNELAEKGLAQRTRGGLRRLDHVEDGAVPYAFRAGRYAEEKSRIARRAMSLLKPGDSVFVDGGTTTFQIIQFMPAFPVNVITNSLRLASALAERCSAPDGVPFRVLISGGALQSESGLLLGPQSVRTLGEYQADWAFISPGGIDGDGFYNANEEVAAAERVMIHHASRTAVLAHPGKLGRRALYRIAGLEAVSRVVAVRGLAPEFRNRLGALGVILDEVD